MKTYFITNKATYLVEKTNDVKNPLLLTKVTVCNSWLANPEVCKNAGSLIGSNVDEFLSKCVSEEEHEKYLHRYETPEAQAIREANRAKREAQKAERAQKAIQFKEQLKREFEALWSQNLIEVNEESVKTILFYSHYFEMPEFRGKKFTIGFSVNEYDCDGKIAIAMKLDKKIRVYDVLTNKIVVGAPHGHLTKYTRI